MKKRSIAGFIFVGAVLRAALVFLCIIILVFVIAPPGLNLQPNIKIVDSLLYSIGGPVAVVLVSAYWSMIGAIGGAVLSCFLFLRATLRNIE